MGTPIEVTAKTTEHPDPQTITYDFGDTLKEMTELFGEDVVFSSARAQMIVGLQARMRNLINDGKDPAVLADIWKPGVKSSAPVDHLAAARTLVKGMDDDARQEFINSLLAG